MRSFRTIKTVLTIVLLSVALLAAVVALSWRRLLTPEQKLGLGLWESAGEGFAQRARRSPEDGAALSDYAAALIAGGNFGRALYLRGLYGAHCEGIDELGEVLDQCAAAMAKGETFDAAHTPFAEERKEQPCYQALLYLTGYQHALLGDWASAKNSFAAIEPGKLPAGLRDLYAYYLARCYRLAGTPEEQGKVEGLLRGLLDGQAQAGLLAKARYNLAAWYLASGGGGDGVSKVAVLLQDLRLMQSEPVPPSARWALQKTLSEVAQAALDGGDAKAAFAAASEALTAGPGESGAKGALELLAEALAQVPSAERAGLKLGDGLLSAVGAAGAASGLEKVALRTLVELRRRELSAAQKDELVLGLSACHISLKDSAGEEDLIAGANLLGASDAAMSKVFHDYAALLEGQKQWNAALEHYRYSAGLGGLEAGAAVLGQYRVLKEVQEPLDIPRATELLRSVLKHYPSSPAALKAAEELLPLLIWQGRGAEARSVAEGLALSAPVTEGSVEQRKDSVQAAQLGNFWLAYLAEQKGQSSREYLAKITLRYFGYYEVCAGARPGADFSAEPSAIKRTENPAEYLAGMGLTDEAKEWAADELRPPSAIEQYCELDFDARAKPLYTAQYEASGMLESGAAADCREAALLTYALAQASPTPHRKEAQAACAQAGVPLALLYAVVKKESGFREGAKSGAGAQGLMQVMPGTIRFLIDARGLPADSLARRFEPAVNLRLGAEYLASLRGEVGPLAPGKAPDWAAGKIDTGFSDPVLRAVLHAYNGGPANYRKWRERYGAADALLFTELLPNEENEGYVKKVWKFAHLYQDVLGE